MGYNEFRSNTKGSSSYVPFVDPINTLQSIYLAMPNTRKSKTNLLPKSERHHASSKILIVSTTSSPPSLSPPPPPLSDPHALPSSSAPHLNPQTLKPPKPPELDDESLSRLLSFAGPFTILSALKVCTQWRRVALDLLSRVSRIDVSKVYTVGTRRITPPTESQLVNMLMRFPTLQKLSLHRWPYPDVMEHVATVICTGYVSTTLRDVELLGVPLKGADIVTLLQNCPTVSTLRLGEHSSVNDALLQEISLHFEKTRATDSEYRLETIVISRASKVSQLGFASLLHSARPDTLLSKNCKGIRALKWSTVRDSPSERVSFVSCSHLTAVKLKVQPSKPDVLSFNLSQCSQLADLSFKGPNLGLDYALALKQLNLSGCRCLRRIAVSAREEGWKAFQNLEELVLFGAYLIDSQWFRSTFGLSQQLCAMPNLRRLSVNGCQLDVLRLIGYEHLTSVDCSGCPILDTLEIRDCWKLEMLIILGKRIPLNTVQLTLPANCTVQGLRKQWHRESHLTNQTIMFP